MFLIDKYKPNDIKTIYFHKKMYKLLETISKDNNVPHMIFYGNEGSGKRTMINIFLKMLYGTLIERDVIYKVTSSNKKIIDEVVKQSNHHIVIEPKNNSFDRYIIHDVVKEYAKRNTLNIFNTEKTFKIVLINNLDTLSYYAQTALRRIMEEFSDKCRFIMWCKSLSKVIKPLQSRCLCFTIPTPTDDEMFFYMLKIIGKENIKLSLNQINKILYISNGNIKKMLLNLEFARFNFKFTNGFDESINDIIANLKTKNITNLRSIIFNLIVTNYEPVYILRNIVDKICLGDFSDNIKSKIINMASKINLCLVKGRHDIIHFDRFFIYIFKIKEY